MLRAAPQPQMARLWQNERAEDVVMDTLVLKLVELFSPTEMRLSEFKDAVKVLRRRTRDDGVRRLADELLVWRDGVNGWKETGRVLLFLMDECGLDTAKEAQKNSYLRILTGSGEGAASTMSDAEYAALIDRRMAQVQSPRVFDRRGDALKFLNSLSQSA